MRLALVAQMWLLLALILAARAIPAAEPESPSLPERIDTLIEAAAVGPLNPPASDADFVRRAYLDLTGVVPTAAEARSFLNDPAEDKRARLIDQLLESPRYARHMALTFDVMLLERRPDKAVKATDWEEYLRKSFADNKPLDQLCRELIVADGADANLRPAARFLLNRECEPNAVTRDIGRMFFGMDLQCAQCHDHPLVEDYYQADYYGLFAFVMRSSLFTDPKSKLALVAEKAEGEANFKSVFTSASADNVRPRLPKGVTIATEPSFAKGEEYVTAPAKNIRPVPKHSRRTLLAEQLKESHQFRRNLANRLWAHLFGRGLVHPLDFHHPANPPSHPELLTVLADELANSNYNTKQMLGQLARTRAYQRACDAPNPADVVRQSATDEIARLEARRPGLGAQLAESKAARERALEAQQALAARLSTQQQEIAALETAATAAQQTADKALAEQTSAEARVASLKEQAQLVTNAALRTSVAVKKLAGDEAVAQAFALLDGRAKDLTAEAEKAAQAATELTAKNEPILAQAKAAQEAVAAAQSLLPRDELAARQREVVDEQVKVADAQYTLTALDAQLATARAWHDWQGKQEDPAAAAGAWNGLIDRWTTSRQIAELRPLTCEQFALSVMQVTGVLSRQEEAARAALEKKPPDELKNAAESERPKILARLAEQRAFAALRSDLTTFASLYGSLPGEDFQATVNQALFFENGSVLPQYLTTSGGTLVERLASIEDPATLADELFLAVLARLPTAEEKDDLGNLLKDRSDRAAALAEAVWGLVSSNEFRFNH